MTGVTGLHHVQVAAPPGCEQEARAFYGDLLQLREIEKPLLLAVRGGCWFSLGDGELHVGVEDPFRPAAKAHPALLVGSVADLEELAASLAAEGRRDHLGRRCRDPGPAPLPRERSLGQPPRARRSIDALADLGQHRLTRRRRASRGRQLEWRRTGCRGRNEAPASEPLTEGRGQAVRTAIVSTYPPRACGIGAFAADVRSALLGLDDVERVEKVIVVNEPSRPQRPGLTATIAQGVRGDYVRAARILGRLDVDVVLLQHEYGIFGGETGSTSSRSSRSCHSLSS